MHSRRFFPVSSENFQDLDKFVTLEIMFYCSPVVDVSFDFCLVFVLYSNVRLCYRLIFPFFQGLTGLELLQSLPHYRVLKKTEKSILLVFCKC